MQPIFEPNYCLVYKVIIPGSTTIEKSLKFGAENIKMARKHIERLQERGSPLWVSEMGQGTKKGKIKLVKLYVLSYREVKLK